MHSFSMALFLSILFNPLSLLLVIVLDVRDQDSTLTPLHTCPSSFLPLVQKN